MSEYTTEHYQDFVATWASHCGAPKAVFIGQLDVTIAAEVEAALSAAGHQIVSRDRLAALQEAVALLNSMVLSGESLTARSQEAVCAALHDQPEPAR